MEQKDEIAIFGGGCFWCTEAVFTRLKGVGSVLPGYSGGHAENPTYEQVCGEATGHAEVIRVEFDPAQIAYTDLLEVFFATHDPTTLNRQGADTGTRYRSLILHTSDAQKSQAEEYVAGLEKSGEHGSPIVTEFAPFEIFYEAEAEHLRFFAENPRSMYCQIVISPKIEKLEKGFAQRLS